MLIDPARPWKVLHKNGRIVAQMKSAAGANHYAQELIRQKGEDHTVKYWTSFHHPNCSNPDNATPRSLCPHCSDLA
jgi:hypothetical protein